MIAENDEMSARNQQRWQARPSFIFVSLSLMQMPWQLRKRTAVILIHLRLFIHTFIRSTLSHHSNERCIMVTQICALENFITKNFPDFGSVNLMVTKPLRP